jgi:hypothetical protein
MKKDGFPFHRVAAVSGSGQQHGRCACQKGRGTHARCDHQQRRGWWASSRRMAHGPPPLLCSVYWAIGGAAKLAHASPADPLTKALDGRCPCMGGASTVHGCGASAPHGCGASAPHGCGASAPHGCGASALHDCGARKALCTAAAQELGTIHPSPSPFPPSPLPPLLPTRTRRQAPSRAPPAPSGWTRPPPLSATRWRRVCRAAPPKWRPLRAAGRTCGSPATRSRASPAPSPPCTPPQSASAWCVSLTDGGAEVWGT